MTLNTNKSPSSLTKTLNNLLDVKSTDNTMRFSSTFFSILVLLETPAVFAQTCQAEHDNCLGNEDSCCGGLNCIGGNWSKQCKKDPNASCLHEWAECTDNVNGKSIMVAIHDSPYHFLFAFFFTLCFLGVVEVSKSILILCSSFTLTM
jgi:hypothetical protein